MKNRVVSKMWAGLNSYIAMEREEVRPIVEWGCERV